MMENKTTPSNGAEVKFMRKDEDEWKLGEFDEQNQMFIEIYSAELITHNLDDILKWKYTD